MMKEFTNGSISDYKRQRRFVRLKRSKLTTSAQRQGFRVGFACDRTQREKSFRLVYKRYREVGLIQGPPDGMWYTVFHALPASRTAVALLEEEGGEPISTSTLIEDSPLGLPSDSIYKDKIDAFREKGHRIAEVSCLAALPLERGRNSFLHVFRLMGLYSLYKGIDDLIISVHPKHTQFYEDILLFQPIGDVRYYPYLKDAPAILEHLHVKTAPQRYLETFSGYPPECDMSLFMLGKDQVHLKRLKDMMDELECEEPLSYDDFYYFFVEKRPIWQELGREKREFFEEIYPGITRFIEKKMLSS